MADGSGKLVALQYRLVEEIGRGGFGVVWRAHDEQLHREVAAKELFLPTYLASDQRHERRARSMREARSAARIDHPSAIKVYDVVEHDGCPWIIMEFVEGRPLNAIVKAGGPLPPLRAADIGLKLLGALRAAHAAGVVHRDVKPGNVLVGEGRAVLTDFGIATIEGDDSLTHSGFVMGAPAYTAPERARGEHAVPASDLWSLGATLFYAVEGRRPYAGSNANAIFHSILNDDPPRPTRAGPLAPVIEGLLRQDVDDRLTAEETERLLAAVVTGRRSVPPARRRSRRPAHGVRRPRRRTLAAVVVPPAALLLTATLLWTGGSADSPRRSTMRSSTGSPKLIGSLPGDSVWSVAFARDGRTLAVGGEDRTVRLWDVTSGRVRGVLTGHGHTVFSVAFSPDGRTIAGGGYDGKVILWDLARRAARRTMEMPGTGVGTVAFSPDGRVLACAGNESVRLWSVSRRAWTRTLRAPGEYAFTAAFSPHGPLAIAGQEAIRVWRSTAPDTRGVRLGTVPSLVTALAFSPDGHMLAAAGQDGRIMLWRPRGRIARVLGGGAESATAVAFSPDGRTVAGATGKVVRLWNAATGRPAGVLGGHTDVVQTVAFSPDGRLLATGGDDGTVRLWSMPA